MNTDRFARAARCLLARGGVIAALFAAWTGAAAAGDDLMNFHFDEGAGATRFDDLSAANRAASCDGSACPTAGAIGLRGTPRHDNRGWPLISTVLTTA